MFSLDFPGPPNEHRARASLPSQGWYDGSAARGQLPLRAKDLFQFDASERVIVGLSGAAKARANSAKPWVVVPTYGRSEKGYFDYSAVLDRDRVVVLLVRPGAEFEAYSRSLGDVHIIVELPLALDGVGVDDGGVGLARRFAQKLFGAWGLE